MLTTPIGTLAVACAAFNDAVGWLILAAITAIVRAGSLADAGLPLLGSLASTRLSWWESCGRYS